VTDDIVITPPALARRYGVNVSKILHFIRCGELKALNLSTKRDGRPRWRITADAVRDFEASRSSAPPARTARRRRTHFPEHITAYFK
jgi:hypothetical protein